MLLPVSLTVRARLVIDKEHVCAEGAVTAQALPVLAVPSIAMPEP